MSFDRAIKLVLDYEGRVFENDANDPGGKTKFGISQRAYPTEDILNLTEDRAKELYRRDYWDQLMGDELPEKLGIVVFDCAVNQGLKTAIRLMQAVLELEVDGLIGPKTIEAAKKTADRTAWFYLLHRARLYMGLKTCAHWGSNWGLRLTKLADDLFPKEA